MSCGNAIAAQFFTTSKDNKAAALLSLEVVKNCAAIAFPHDIYEEEVFAFIIAKDSKNIDRVKAQNILNLLRKKISYYKLPGYIQFTNYIPITSTQKIVKSELTFNYLLC